MKLFFIVLIAFSLSCSKDKKNIISENNIETDSSIEQILKYKLQSSDLNGVWTKKFGENAFQIRNDSLFFIEGEPVAIKLNGDTLITIYSENFKKKDIVIKLNKDSLIVKNSFGEIIEYLKEH